MNEINRTNEFPLTVKSAHAAAGCMCGHDHAATVAEPSAGHAAAGGCACGHGHDHSHGHSHAQLSEAAVTHPGHEHASRLVTTTIGVSGMTCAHCVSSVTEEISEVAGVQAVDVALNPGGVSTVTVSSAVPVGLQALQQAVVDAGYTLVEE